MQFLKQNRYSPRLNQGCGSMDSYLKADFNHYLIFAINKETHLLSEIPILKSRN